MQKTEKLKAPGIKTGGSEDFDSFSFDDDFSLEPPKDNRKPIRRVMDGSLQGAKASLFDPGKAATLLKRNMPDGYGDVIDFADDVAANSRSILSSATNQLKPILGDMAKAAKKLLPGAALKARLQSIEDWGKGSQLSSNDPEKQRDAQIQMTLAELFKAQAEDNAQSSANEKVNQALDQKRHKDLFGVMAVVAKGVSSLTQYQNTIGVQFQRKSLELQYRQYYLAMDSFQETKRSNAMMLGELRAITKNSGLPDYVKLTATENFKAKMRDRFQDKLFSGSKEFMSGFFKNVKGVVEDRVSHAISLFENATQGFNDVNDAKEMVESMGGKLDPAEIAGSMAGGMVTDTLMGKLGTLFRQKILDKNPYGIVGKMKRAGNTVNNIHNTATSWKKSNQNPYENYEAEPSWFKRQAKKIGFHLVEGVRNSIPHTSPDMGVNADGLEDNLDPGKFTKQTNRSITEIIPGYLAMILRSTESIRTGKDQELIVYDYTKSAFSTSRSARSSIFKKISPDSSSSDVKERFSDFAEGNVKGYDKVLPDAKKALADHIKDLNEQGRSPTSEDLASIKFYRNIPGLAPHAERFATMFQNYFAVNGEGKVKDINKSLNTSRKGIYENSVMSVGSSANMKQVETLIDLIDPQKTLFTKDERNLLAKKFMKDRSNNEDFTHYRTGKDGTFAGDELTANFAPKITDAFRSYYGLDQNGKAGSTIINDESFQKKNEAIIEASGRIGTYLKDPRKTIQAFYDLGLGSLVRDTGIMDKTGKKVDFEALQRYGLGDQYTPGARTAEDAELYSSTAGTAGTPQKSFAEQFQDYATRSLEIADLSSSLLMNIRDNTGSGKGIRGRMAKSDVTAKEGIVKISGRKALEAYRKLKISRWRYKPGEGIDGEQDEHVGPMAQDVNKELGENFAPTGKKIDLVSMNGANMAAIQGLDEKIDTQQDTMMQFLKANSARQEIQGIFYNTTEMLKQNTLFGSMMLRSLKIDLGSVDMANVKNTLTSFYQNARNFNFEDHKVRDAILNSKNFVTRNLRRLQRVIQDDSGKTGVISGMRNTVAGGLGVLAEGGDVMERAKEKIQNSKGMQYVKSYGREKIEAAKDWWEIDDIYIEGEEEPRMTAFQIKNGMFYREADGKTIEKTKDIIDTILRRDDNSVVLKFSEIPKIVTYSKRAKKAIKTGIDLMGKTIRKIRVLGQRQWRNSFGSFKQNLKRVKNAIVGYMNMPVDIYTKDDPLTPAMTAFIMSNGGYVLAGNPNHVVKTLADLKGAVKNLEGDYVLTEQNLREGIFDKHGKPIRTPFQKFKDMAKTAVLGTLGLSISATRKLREMFKNGKDRATRMFSNIKEKIKDKINLNIGLSRDTALLLEIRDILDTRLKVPKKRAFNDTDGDGIRDGVKKLVNKNDIKKETPKPDKPEEKKEGETEGILGKALSGLGSLLGGLGEVAKTWVLGKIGLGAAATAASTIAGGAAGAAATGAAEAGAGAVAATAAKKGITRTILSGLGKMSWWALKNGAKLGFHAARWGTGLAFNGLVTAFPWLANMGMAAITGLGTFLTAPAIMTAAAVAGTAYAAYKTYKYFTRNNLNDYTEMRYAQYGFSKSNTDYVAMVLNLEKMVEEHLVGYSKGRAFYLSNPKKFDYKEAMDIFDLDSENKEQAEPWLKWFNNRFKPFFINTLNKLRRLGEFGLDKIEKLDPKQKAWFIENSKFLEGPFDEVTSPIPGIKELSSSKEEVEGVVARVRKDTGDQKIQVLKKIETLEANGDVVSKKLADDLRKENGMEVDKTPKPWYTKASLWFLKWTPHGQLMQLSASAITTVQVYGEKLARNLGFTVTAIEAIRFKCYGIDKMVPRLVNNLRALEDATASGIKYEGNQPVWSGSIDYIQKTVGRDFGIYENMGIKISDFGIWFTKRFLPVFLVYMGFLKQETGKTELNIGETLIKKAKLFEIAKRMINMSDAWKVDYSPWSDYKVLTSNPTVNENLNILKEEADKERMTEQKKSDKPSASPDKKILEKPSTSVAPPSPNVNKDGYRGSLDDTNRNVSNSSPSTTVPSSARSENSAMNDSPMLGGLNSGGYSGSAKGTGDAASVPNAAPGKSGFDAVKDTLYAAAKAVGIDPRLLVGMAGAESGFNPNSGYFPGFTMSNWVGKDKGAKGLFQFLTSTWHAMIKKYGAPLYGFTHDTSVFDARANALMGAHYIKDNASEIRRTKPNPEPADLYMAHFLGSGGANKFFSAPPNEPAYKYFPDPAEKNEPVFWNTGGKKGNRSNPRTISQVYDEMKRRMYASLKKHGLNFDSGATAVSASMRDSGSSNTEPVPMARKAAPSSSDASASIPTPSASPSTSAGSTAISKVGSAPPAPVSDTASTYAPKASADTYKAAASPAYSGFGETRKRDSQPSMDLRGDIGSVVKGVETILSELVAVEKSALSELRGIKAAILGLANAPTSAKPEEASKLQAEPKLPPRQASEPVLSFMST